MKIRPILAVATLALLAGAACATTETTSDPTAATAATDDGHLTDREAISGWYAEYGHILSDFGQASDTIAIAASGSDLLGMVTGCRQMARVAEAGQAAQPIPVATVDVHWQQALTNYSLAATTCIAGGINHDAETIDAASDYMNTANAAVAAASEATSDLL